MGLLYLAIKMFLHLLLFVLPSVFLQHLELTVLCVVGMLNQLVYTGCADKSQPNLLTDVFCLMVRIFRLMLVFLYT